MTYMTSGKFSSRDIPERKLCERDSQKMFQRDLSQRMVVIRTSKYIVLLTVSLLALCSCSPAPKIPQNIESLVREQCVSESLLLGPTNGSSLKDVKTALGRAVRHEFTVLSTNGVWTQIGVIVDAGDGIQFSLLFLADKLVKITNPVYPGTEEYPYQGTTASRIKSWDIEDTGLVQGALLAPALTSGQTRSACEDARQTHEKYKGHGNIAAPIFTALGVGMLPRIEQQYPQNEELRQRYDGCRVLIGMNTNDVDALYGKPLRIFQTGTGRGARIYGDHRYLDAVNPSFRFSFVAIVFDAAQHVAAIYSNQFFNDDWDPEMPLNVRR